MIVFANAVLGVTVPSAATVPKLLPKLFTYVVEAKSAFVVVVKTEFAKASDIVTVPSLATVPKLEPKLLTNELVAKVESFVVVITLFAKDCDMLCKLPLASYVPTDEAKLFAYVLVANLFDAVTLKT